MENNSRLDDEWTAAAEGRGAAKKAAHTQAIKDGRAAEESASEATGFYRDRTDNINTGSLAEGNAYRPGSGKAKVKGFKSATPIMFIVGVLAAAVGGVSVVQIAAPFGFIANAKEWYNTTSVAHKLRANSLFKDLLSSKKKGDDNTPKALSSDTKNGGKFAVSDEMKEELETNGIKYIDAEEAGTNVLAFKNTNDGQYYFVAADDDELNKLHGKVEIDGEEVQVRNKMTLDEKLDTDTAFLSKFSASLRQWKGQIAGWYDSISELYHGRIGNNRNKLADLPGDQEVPVEDIIEAVHNNGRKEKIDATRGDPTYQTVDEDGNVVEDGEKVHVSTDDDSITPDLKEDGLKSSLTGRAKKAAGAASSGGTVACMVVKAAGAIDTAVTALNTIKILNFTTAVMESIDKTKVGDGAGAMLAFMKALSLPGETKGIVDGEWKTVKTGTSTLQSPAWNQFFGGAPVQGGDATMAIFGSGDVLKNALSAKNWGAMGQVVGDLGQTIADFGGGAEATRACLALDAADNALDLVEKVGAFMTLGPLGIVLDIGINMAFQVVIENVVGKIVEFVLPSLANSIAVDIVSNMAGEMAGYALLAGANIYMGQRHIATSGMIGSAAQIAEQEQQAQILAAEQAKIDRYELSPFDFTNKNTFLGQVTYAMLPTLFNLSAPMAAISSLVGTTTKSIASLLPTVSAASDALDFKDSINTDCSMSSLKASDGGVAIGDAGCYPRAYQSTKFADWSTLDVYQEMNNKGYLDGVDSDGNPRVKSGSRYELWLKNCTTRMAKWGYVSTQVDTTGESGGLEGVLKEGFESTSVGQIISDITSQGQIDWMTGQECLTGADVDLFGEYNLRQEMLESGGIISKSSTTAVLEKYYEEHPIDWSLEGQIAMYSGMTKEQVDETLGIIEYANYITNYDADELFPVGPREEGPVYFEPESVVAQVIPDGVLGKKIIYADLRRLEVTA